MRLERLTATPIAGGNGVVLTWENPQPAAFPGVRVVRRTRRHPTGPTDGVVVAHASGLLSATDTGLAAEAVYYYALFPFSAGPAFDVDPDNRVAALVTGAYDFAGQMAELLPAVYHRYDVRGQLRAFLDLPGSQLDRLYGLVRTLSDLRHRERLDGRLLDLLAHWIGWDTDRRLEYDGQRNELRHAPEVYRRVQLIPTVEATVKRLSGWESRTKEYVHNVFAANRPEGLRLALRRRTGAGVFEDVWTSVHAAPCGRPAAARDGAGVLRIFYEVRRGARTEIWTRPLDAPASEPAEPFARAADVSAQPAAALRGTTLSVFWTETDAVPGEARLRTRRRTGSGAWSAAETMPDTGARPCRPQAVVDDAGGLWLFWSERGPRGWTLRYRRHDGAVWSAPVSFPLDGAADPRVEADPFVLFHPTAPAGRRLWVFWTRQRPAADAGRTLATIAFRTKATLAPDAGNWSAVAEMPPVSPASHDREPAALPTGGDLELFFGSNCSGAWAIVRRVFTLATSTWGPATPVAAGPSSERHPLAVALGADAALVYRTSAPRRLVSGVYAATETVDRRDAGSTTPHVLDTAKRALAGTFDDFQCYTHDTGPDGGARTDADRVARDTLGVFVTPDTADPAAVAAGVTRVRRVLGRFMPATDRAVFVTEP